MVDEAATISEETTAEAENVAAAAEEQTTALTEVTQSVSNLANQASQLSQALDRFETDAKRTPGTSHHDTEQDDTAGELASPAADRGGDSVPELDRREPQDATQTESADADDEEPAATPENDGETGGGEADAENDDDADGGNADEDVFSFGDTESPPASEDN
jgi:methyl-accepting chemotaxis protein